MWSEDKVGNTGDVNIGPNLAKHWSACLMLSIWVTSLQSAGFQIKHIFKYFAGSTTPISVLEPAKTHELSLCQKRISETKKNCSNWIYSRREICCQGRKHCLLSPLHFFWDTAVTPSIFTSCSLYSCFCFILFFGIITSHGFLSVLLYICPPYSLPAILPCSSRERWQRQCKAHTAPGPQLHSINFACWMPQTHYICLSVLILDIWQLQIIDGPRSSPLSIDPPSVIGIAVTATGVLSHLHFPQVLWMFLEHSFHSAIKG